MFNVNNFTVLRIEILNADLYIESRVFLHYTLDTRTKPDTLEIMFELSLCILMQK